MGNPSRYDEPAHHLLNTSKIVFPLLHASCLLQFFMLRVTVDEVDSESMVTTQIPVLLRSPYCTFLLMCHHRYWEDGIVSLSGSTMSCFETCQ